FDIEQILHRERHAGQRTECLARRGIECLGALARALRRDGGKGIQLLVECPDPCERSLDRRQCAFAPAHGCGNVAGRSRYARHFRQALNTGAGSMSSGNLNSVTRAACCSVTFRLASTCGYQLFLMFSRSIFSEASKINMSSISSLDTRGAPAFAAFLAAPDFLPDLFMYWPQDGVKAFQVHRNPGAESPQATRGYIRLRAQTTPARSVLPLRSCRRASQSPGRKEGAQRSGRAKRTDSSFQAILSGPATDSKRPPEPKHRVPR